jgi:hypothetical protein
MKAKSGTTKSRFDERADFSAQIASLPFIRNHAFARNSTKRWFFKAFGVFSKAFYEMPKKETVNLRLENANLCLAFGWEHFIFTNRFCGRAFFFDYSDALFEE